MLLVPWPCYSIDSSNLPAVPFGVKTFHVALGCLLHLQQTYDSLPWALGGDFNVVASLEECSGMVAPDLGSMNDFAEYLSQSGLCDLPTVGGTFTWTGIRSRGRVWIDFYSLPRGSLCFQIALWSCLGD